MHLLQVLTIIYIVYKYFVRVLGGLGTDQGIHRVNAFLLTKFSAYETASGTN